jgi:hypothetical protein
VSKYKVASALLICATASASVALGAGADDGDRSCTGDPARHTVAAGIIDGDSSDLPTSVLWPVLNGWQVSNHKRATLVYAGGSGIGTGAPHSRGRFAILRQNYVCLTSRIDYVDVPHAGPVTIVRAPEGRGRVQTRAQERGRLRFVGKRGVTGVLHLKDDRVVFDRSQQ